jgi:3-methylfumaryl-CoA hydratase
MILPVWRRALAAAQRQTDKSFLVLFPKKEHLACSAQEQSMTDFQDAVGREEHGREAISPELARRFRDTLAAGPAPGGDGALLGIQWCIAPQTAPIADTGGDGHLRTGGFLPALPLPRRMWAGGALRFEDALREGDVVERHSQIAAVRMTQGRSGPLCFVTVAHDYATARGVALRERQDLVYRAAATAAGPLPGEPAAPDRPGDVVAEIEASSLLLFRYSALTFNGHRIHYDRDYARDVEFYPGLVVHGPMQASFALRLAASLEPGRRVAAFRFRGVAPMVDGGRFRLRARRAEAGRMGVEVIAQDGRLTTVAELDWA